jgi:hypothetical protein
MCCIVFVLANSVVACRPGVARGKEAQVGLEPMATRGPPPRPQAIRRRANMCWKLIKRVGKTKSAKRKEGECERNGDKEKQKGRGRLRVVELLPAISSFDLGWGQSHSPPKASDLSQYLQVSQATPEP